MKVTIACRFQFDNIEVDNEADCRFFFLLSKVDGKVGFRGTRTPTKTFAD